MPRRALSLGLGILMVAGLAGCGGGGLSLGGMGGVSIAGTERKIEIEAPSDYDTLAIAEGHCKNYKKRAVYAGRGELAGERTLTIFNCMER